MGDKKRTTVVRGYRELHNSWPSHNRAAQGCERADGMSFSFVSRRGDYFSFHSFVPRFLCLPPPSLLSFSSLLFGSPFISLCVPRAVPLSPSCARPSLSHGPFFRSRCSAPFHFGVSRHKVIILRDAREKLRTERGPDGARFVNVTRGNGLVPGGTPAP